MGKKKIEVMELIKNPYNRKITYLKRKKGLLKKAMELSILCGQNIFMVMYDNLKDKIVIYRTSNELSSSTIKEVFSQENINNAAVEFYTDEDYTRVKDTNDPRIGKKSNPTISEPDVKENKIKFDEKSEN